MYQKFKDDWENASKENIVGRKFFIKTRPFNVRKKELSHSERLLYK